ncbi:OmpL47-type beta-barrel domain-containing protein [Arthrobacter sp. SAFR-044]|uniref:beta strand repeat-containing protein n=1 Tax=Arthrobacter sp. SAFR-044 TaxID=3387278 RepID=UPI003F7C9D48
MSLAARNPSLFVGRRPSRRLAWIITAILLLLGSGTAYAFWASTTSSSKAAAAADALTPGSKPAVNANAAAISVTWANGTTVNGRAATGYTVARYSTATGGTAIPATDGCAGSVTTLTCTEQNVPGGTWYYTVTPAIALWTGAESPRSNGISSDTLPPTASVSVSPTPNAGWNNTSPVTVTITADDGTNGSGVASITYSVDGAQQTVNAAVATIPVAGDGTHTVSYFATDKVGNSGLATSQPVNIDTQAPAAPGLTVPQYVNLARVAGVTVTGTAEANAKITLTATDAGSAHTTPAATPTADSTGKWTASLDLTSLNEGAVAYRATATDAAGNTGAARIATSTKDTNVPDAASGLTVPPYVFSGNLNNVLVKGSAEAGSTLNIVAKDSAGSTAQGTVTTVDGAWSLTLNLGSTSGMVDGSVAYTVTVTDGAGNSSSPATTTNIRDTNVSLTLNTPLNILAGNVNNYAFSGTTDSGLPVSVSVTDGTTTIPGAASGATWTTGSLNLSELKDSSTSPVVIVTATATTNDAAGNSTTVSATVTMDTKVPTSTVSLSNGGGTQGLGKAEQGDSLTIQFSEPMDPSKICSGWTTKNAQTLSGNGDITVKVSTANVLTVSSTSCPSLNVGSIFLGNNAAYGSAGALSFNGNGNNASTVTWNGSTTLSIKLGKSTAATSGTTATGDVPAYTPGTGLTDLAGNSLGTGPFSGTTAYRF